MKISINRILVLAVLASIMVYGILKNWVLKAYASFLDSAAGLIGLDGNALFRLVRNQAEIESVRHQTLGWLIYYPTYFLLHIVFIFLLFDRNRKVRNYLTIGLSVLIILLLSGWSLFSIIGMHEISYFCRLQFRNLFGLPFILLAIEGGRILYNDVENLIKD
ncbi:MAG: hypothetical protein RIA69_00330 [Cyclobacteriaceae bacterium]